jgi:cytoskeletal protein CcmA (bactofilin family)
MAGRWHGCAMRRPLTALAAVLCVAAGFGGPAAAGASADSDVVVLTGGATIAPGQTVDDVVVFDGPVRVAGRVQGSVVAFAGTVTVTGSIDGDLTAFSRRARLLPGAHVGGDLLYGSDAPSIARGATVAGEVSDEGWDDLGTGPFPWVLRFLFWLAVSISTLAGGLGLLALVPRAAAAAWSAASDRTGLAAAWGAGLFVGLPLLAVIALATLVGIPLGVGLVLALLPLAAVGYVTSCWLIGRRMLGSERGRVWIFLAGWGLLRVVALVPVLGVLTWIAASAFGLGVLLVAAWYAGDPSRDRPRAAPTPAGAAGPAA